MVNHAAVRPALMLPRPPTSRREGAGGSLRPVPLLLVGDEIAEAGMMREDLGKAH